MDAVVKELVASLYPDAEGLEKRVMDLVGRYRELIARHRESFSEAEAVFPLTEQDAILSADGDSFTPGPGEDARPLSLLHRFLDEYCEETITGIHLSRFRPEPAADRPTPSEMSMLSPESGTWKDTEEIAGEFRLMVDLPIESPPRQPEALLELLTTFLDHLARGAQIVGVNLIAEGEADAATHRSLMKLLRRVLESADPAGLLATDSNSSLAPEAHIVYNTELAPVLMEAAATSEAAHLTSWARRIEDPGDGRSFLTMCTGGPDVDFLSAATTAALPDRRRAAQFLAAQAVALAFIGVPEIPLHSLIGTEHADDSRQHTGHDARPNGTKPTLAAVTAELAQADSLRANVFEGYRRLLRARAASPAFHPRSPQRVVDADPRLVVLVRGPFGGESGSGEDRVGEGREPSDAVPDERARSGGARVLALHNLSSETVGFRDRRDKYPWSEEGVARDLVSGDIVFPTPEGALFSLDLEPYEVLWLSF